MEELIVFCLGVLFFFFTILLSSILYKIKYKEKYCLLNHFPFELGKEIWVNILILFISSIFIISSGMRFLLNASLHVNYFLSNVIGVLFIISYVLMYSIFQIRFDKSFKGHIIVSSFFALLSFVLDIFGILYILRSDNFNKLFIIPFALFTFIKLTLIILTFIKGIESNNKIINNDEIIYKRKKVISLSLLEWGNVILLIMSNFIYLIMIK